MRAIYNGVDLMAIRTHYMNWEPVYDDSGVDYLYTRVSFACRGLVSGFASVLPTVAGPFLNYKFDGGKVAELRAGRSSARAATRTFPPPNVPDNSGLNTPREKLTLRSIIVNPIGDTPGGNDPTNTLESIRHRLTTPRGKLYLFWGPGMETGTPKAGTDKAPTASVKGAQTARIFLESPVTPPGGPSAKCDCKNGPVPRLLGVVGADGDAQTLTVDWAVETYVNESDDNNVSPNGALLSNRFVQSHEIRDDSYTVITTQGLAVFRTDFVYELPNSPDSQRSVLFMPIPQGFTRRILYCRGREDVTGVEYAYEDSQQSVNFVAGPYVKAASISAVHRQAIFNQPDLWANSPLTVYERVLGIAANKHFANAGQKAAREGRPAKTGKGKTAQNRPVPKKKAP